MIHLSQIIHGLENFIFTFYLIGCNTIYHLHALSTAILKFNPKPVLSTQFELKLEEKINCRASAATKVSFTWMKDNEENTEWDDHVSIGYEWDAQTSIANGMLMFNGAKMSDTGAYTCTARTEDDVINATIKVEVFGKSSSCQDRIRSLTSAQLNR